MEKEPKGKGIEIAAAILAGLFLLTWLTPLLSPSAAWMPVANAIATFLFLGLPMAFTYQWSRSGWRPQVHALLLVGSIALLVLAILAPQSAGVGAVRQIAVILGATSLGMLVAAAIRDPNLLAPIAPVLAIVDIITVLSPIGIAKTVIERAPNVLPSIAVSVPQFARTAQGHPTIQHLFMGPADVLFLAMFFAVIHRAGFRARETFLWLLPTLVGYMLVVEFFGDRHIGPILLDNLPALLPMAAVILLVNRRCFTMTRQEKIMSGALVGVALVVAVLAFQLPR
jgi:hypothetical protein